MIKFNVGDVLQFKNANSVTRCVTAVRETGYSWKHVSDDEQVHETDDGTDPFLLDGWRLVINDG